MFLHMYSTFSTKVIDKKHVFLEKMRTKMPTVHTKPLFVKSIYYEKFVEKIIIFFILWGTQNPLFPKKLSTSLFFENVHWWHKMVTFFEKMSEKCLTKSRKIMFYYVKILFMKSDKVAELTFFGADFQLLWSTLWP